MLKKEDIKKINATIIDIMKKDYLFKRDGFFLAKEYLDKNKSFIISGLRQIGKTIIMKQLLAENKEKSIFINIEEGNTKDEIRELISKFYFEDNKRIFLIDEIQNISDWGSWIIDLYNAFAGSAFVLSGSSSIKTSQTTGSARFRDVRLLPLSLDEYMRFSGDEATGEVLLDNYMGKNAITAYTYDKNITYEQINNDYLQTYILKDILRYENNLSIDLIKKLLMTLKNNTSGEFSYKKINELIFKSDNSNNYVKISQLIDVLIKYNVVKKLRRFNLEGDESKKFKIYINPHLYLILNESSFNNISSSKIGYVVESLLFFYLFNEKVTYIKQTSNAKKYAKKEVDFNEENTWCEVKATSSVKNIKNELKKNIMFKEYNKKGLSKKIISFSYEKEINGIKNENIIKLLKK